MNNFNWLCFYKVAGLSLRRILNRFQLSQSSLGVCFIRDKASFKISSTLLKMEGQNKHLWHIMLDCFKKVILQRTQQTIYGSCATVVSTVYKVIVLIGLRNLELSFSSCGIQHCSCPLGISDTGNIKTVLAVNSRYSGRESESF